MTPADLPIFEHYPEPMWVYATDTLRILAVNQAAITHYGYSRDEFLGLTIADIRPPEDVAALRARVESARGGPGEPGFRKVGRWRHRLKDGSVIDTEIVEQPVPFADGNAMLVIARDITRQLAAEREREALLAREVRLRRDAELAAQRLDGISDALFAVDHAGCVTFLNGAAATLLGLARDALPEASLWQAVPRLAGSPLEIECRAAAAERRTRRFTLQDPGSGAWLQASAYPVDDGIAVHLRDVTQERAQQEELRLLQAAVGRMNDILLITEAEAVDEAAGGPRIVYVSDAFVRRTGYGREAVIGRTPRILQGDATDRAELDRIRHALQRRDPVRTELVNYTKDRQPYWVELDITPLADASGWITHWIALQRDITERKQAEAALRRSDERFRLVARATNDAIWDWDVAGGTVWWNETGRRRLGSPSPDIDAVAAWYADIHPEDRDRVRAGLEAAVAGEGDGWADEYRRLGPDGGARTVIDRAFILRDAGGGARRVLGSMLDVTEQRAVDAQLRQAQKLEVVGQLTGGVAHDFNNLLTIVLSSAEELSIGLADPERRELAQMILAAAQRGAELTSRLLAFARQQPLAPVAVDVGRLTARMDGLLRRTLGEHIEIAVTGAAGTGPALVDSGQLELALLNLALNARDAMPGGGRLTIAVAGAVLDTETAAATDPDLAPGAYVLVSVADTGTGMAPEVLAHAVEPFFTTKEAGKGSGLGLSMVYGFVKQSGGHVTIESTPGAGTTVRLLLPRAAAVPAVARPAVSEPDLMGIGEHVLVIEDDPQVRRHVERLLRLLHYRVTAVDQAAAALAVLAEDPTIALLFTDIVMPGGMNGAELAEAAVARRSDLRVLFTSGYSDTVLMRDGRLQPGVEFLPKPYLKLDLALKLRALLRD